MMFVNPVDADGIIPGLDMLKDAEIPMFGFDTQVGDMSYLVSYAGSDNYNAGYVCGEDLAKKVPEGGDILVLDSPTMQSVTDRTNGFLDAIKESGVEFNVVGQQDAQGNQQVANEKVYQLMAGSSLAEHPALMKDVSHARITFWWNRAVDIIPTDGGKGRGIEKMLEYYHFDKSQAMAFGDGNNDIEMLKSVGHGVAMANASDELKAIADDVCGDVAEDGIYYYCLEHGMI